MKFSAKSEEEYKASGQSEGFGLLPDDEYIFEVVSYENKGPIADRFAPADKPRTLTDIRYRVKPLSYADDDTLPLIDDVTQQALNPDKSILIFFKPESLGFGPAGPSKNRKFLAAALGRPIKDRFDDVDLEDLVGGRFIGVVERSADGKYDNIVDFRPLKKATRQRPAPKPAHEDVEDDLPF